MQENMDAQESERHFRYIFDPLKKTTVRVLQETPSRHRPALHITNLEEQKNNFLRFGKTPKFKFTGSVENYSKKKKTFVRFDLLPEAKVILERVRQQFGSGDNFLDISYGNRLTACDANEFMVTYVKAHGLDGLLNIVWTHDLNSSARMVWHGPNARFNRPEARKFTLYLRRTEDNIFLRERGIRGLADHEIGTHFMRMNNDGLQPWFSNRQKFGLRSSKSFCGVICEEGLAAVNNTLQSHVKLLWVPALLYYTACMAQNMGFKELFDHLGTHVSDLDHRWKLVMRAKRILADCNQPGGSGQDQCYFEGAVKILRQVNDIDFKLLYAGKICTDEIKRIRRIARRDCLRYPYFLKDLPTYKRLLNEIAVANGIIIKVERPISYRKRGSAKNKIKKIRSPNRRRTLSTSNRATTVPIAPHPPLLSKRGRRSADSLKYNTNDKE